MSLLDLLFALTLIWVAAQLFGGIAERLKQPVVLGELVAGMLLGVGGLHWIDPEAPTLEFLAELGVLILLFEIGLETRLGDLLRVGGASAVVALTGVLLPLAGGYAVGRAFGADPLLAVFLGATLTATSVGVTGRVLRDMGQLASTEARIILGAAVIDDVLGLILLGLVGSVVAGGSLAPGVAGRTLFGAVAFVAVALMVGRAVIPRLVGGIVGIRGEAILVPITMTVALTMALVAAKAGSALIIGAFVAGVSLADSPHRQRIERDVGPVAHLLVPVFFVLVGAHVDLRPFNPLVSGSWPILAGVLAVSALAIATKWAAGFAVFWMPIRKSVVGAGMIPRGEVGLIFANMGQTAGLLSGTRFSAIVVVVMITTFAAPLLLRSLLQAPRRKPRRPAASDDPSSVEELVGGS